MSAPPKSLHVGKRLSRNRAVRRATVDQRDVHGNLATMDNIMQHHASTTSKLGKKIEEVKPHYLGKTLASTRPGTDLRNHDKVESSARSSTGWFETPFSAASHEAAARMVDYHHQEKRKAVGPRRPASASSFRRGTATPEKSTRRVAYTVGANESWESVYRRQYRQLLLKKFLALETDYEGKHSEDDDILKAWKEKLLQEPFGSSDPKVQILRRGSPGILGKYTMKIFHAEATIMLNALWFPKYRKVTNCISANTTLAPPLVYTHRPSLRCPWPNRPEPQVQPI